MITLQATDTVVVVGVSLIIIVLAVGIIARLYIAFMRGYRSKVTTDTITTDTDTEPNRTPESSTEGATIEVDQIRDQATDSLTRGEQAEANGQYQQAVDAYKNAISRFEQAAAVADDETKSQLDSKIEETQAALDSLTAVREARDSLRTTLKAAERSFKEAIVQYSANGQTVARVRFRQARDTFEDAQQTITASDTESLAQPIAVSFEHEATLQSQALEELALLEESTLETLAAADIKSVTDLDTDAEKITPPVITDLEESDEISDEEVVLLTILSWWYGGEKREFGSEAQVSQRYEQADYGFNQCT